MKATFTVRICDDQHTYFAIDGVDVTASVEVATGQDWRTWIIREDCLQVIDERVSDGT